MTAVPPPSALALLALLALAGPVAAAEGAAGGAPSDTTKPSADTTKPSADTTKPSADEAKPSADTTKPSADETKPSPDDTKRGADAALTLDAINDATFAPSAEADRADSGKAPKTASAKRRSGKAKETSEKKRPTALLVKVQVLLDRAHVSPGAIDGRDGENLRGALAAFAAARGLPPAKALNRELFDALAATSGEPVATSYTITEADVAGPFVERIPRKMEEQADLEAMGYTNVREMLAERFHMARDLLTALNPDAALDRAGTVITVAAVPPLETGKPKAEERNGKQVDEGAGKGDSKRRGEGRKADSKETGAEKTGAEKTRAEKTGAGKDEVKEASAEGAPPKDVVRIEVDKSTRHVRAFDKDGALKAFYPASIGSAEKPAPSGEAKVKGVAFAPWYTYNPKYRFEGVKATRKFSIRPGPNNPVGIVWIDLSIPSYGIHGTPEPEKVGKTESHGCIRLTNWDARDLAQRVERGARVEFKDE